ncbi:MAG: hypothetical protein GWP91_19095 [Rhodobacterales bacterium]|nr:hypothetical protein [Rhodobacterales bacterium]
MPLFPRATTVLVASLLLVSACGDGSKSDGSSVTDPTTQPGTSSPCVSDCDLEGLDEAQALLDAAGSGVCDGNLLPSDFDALQTALVTAQATQDGSPDSSDAAMASSALAQALHDATTARIDHRTDLAEMLNGITTIQAPSGTPSKIGVVGCQAISLFQAEKWAHSAIAAGRVGEGRMVVFTKEISASLPELEDRSIDAEMTQFADQILTWLTARNEQGYDGTTPINVLVSHGFDTFDPDWALNLVPIDSPLTDAALFDPTTHPLAIVNPRIEDPAEAAVVLAYLEAGGAVLMGHQVWTWDVDIPNAPGQELIAEAGLLWMPWYSTGGGTVPSIDQLMLANTHHLFDWLQNVEDDWSTHITQGYNPDESGDIANYIVDSYGWLAPDQAALVDPLTARYDAVNVTYPADLTERPYTQSTVPTYHRVMGLFPGQGLGKGVDVFPGLVDASVPRIDSTLTYDFDHADPSWLDVPVDPRQRMATGLYAAPGEDITVTVTPQGLDVSDGLQLNIYIGAHSDSLANHAEIDRPPLVAFSQSVQVGVNTVNNPYGGLLYLQADSSAFRPGQAQVEISGAVAAPSFFASTQTNEQWSAILADGQAPWGDIVGDSMIATLPRDQLAQVSDPQSIATGWDDIVSNSYSMMGLDALNSTPHGIPEGRWHIVEDRQISAGWMHSGYPIMAFEAANLHLIEEVLSWGPYHELGHNLQQSSWKMADSGEVTNNLFSLYNQAQFGQGSRLVDDGRYDSVAVSLAGGATYASLDVWEKLTFYRRLSLAYGWDFYRDLFTMTRQLEWDQGFALESGQSEEDYLLIRGSEVAGEDLRSFFDAYGVGVTQDARDAVEAMGLAEPNPPILNYRE